MTMEGEDSGRSWLAAAYAVPIGVVSGLTGLGGAEFRLPALVGLLRYSARQAVPLNLSVSLFALTTSFFVRSRTLSLNGVLPLFPIVAGFVIGALTMSVVGPTIGARVSDDRLRRLILFLLTLVGISLIYQGFRPLHGIGVVPPILGLRVAAGVIFGLGIGLVSSLTGVAGGELQIPTFVLAFGADIKTAGTASLCVSLPTLAVNVARYASRGAIPCAAVRQTIVPMGAASIIGAAIGAMFAGVVPAAALKIGLGLLLVVSAQRVFRK